MKRQPFLFRGYCGPAYNFDMPHSLSFAIGGRPDLMTHPDDLGRMVLSAIAVDAWWGCSPESVQNNRPKWFSGVYVRSDVSEIARRLAGGDE